MKKNIFTCVAKSVRAKAEPASREEWEAARKTTELASLSALIRNAKTEEEVKELKGKLPVWTPRCAQFRNNRRKESEALLPLNRLMLDIDEKGHTDEIMNIMIRQNNRLYLKIKECVLRVLLVENSIRMGTHILVEMPEGMSATDIQQQVSQAIGFRCDPAVKNVAGCIYMVPDSYSRFVDEDLFIVNNTDTTEEKAAATPDDTGKTGVHTPSEALIEDPAESSIKTEAGHLLSYHGIPYNAIISCYWKMFNDGHEPCKGDRDVKTFEIAATLRSICDYDQTLLESIIPCYDGFTTEERNKCIANALKQPHESMPFRLKQVLTALKNQQVLSGTGSTSTNVSTAIPACPEQWPKPLDIISSKVPDAYKPTVNEAVWPALCAHLHGVKVQYINGKIYEPYFSSVLIAPQSSGKSFINEPINCILEDIKERDDENQERENAWREQNRRKGANKDRTPRPEDICIQWQPSDLTAAALCQALIDAEKNGKKCIYIMVDEIELLKKMGNGKTELIALLIRCGYDVSMWGQSRVGVESVNGKAPVRLVICASTTPSSASAFFGKSWFSDGTLTRITLNTISLPEGYDEAPEIGLYDDIYKESIKPYIERLNNANGLIECPEANRVAKEMEKELKEIADLSEHKGYEIYSRRAIQNGWYRAIMLYIMNNYQWDDSIEKFMRYSVMRDMWVKMEYFGEIICKVAEADMQHKGQQPTDLLVLCPEEFTEQDFIDIRRRAGKQDGDYKSTLRCWKRRGKIEYDSISKTYRKTA